MTSALVAELTVVRHGESLANAAFRVAARDGVDAGVPGPDRAVGLSALGREQAAALGHALAATPPAVAAPHLVLCSPYARARQTWEIASAAAAGDGLRPARASFDARLGDRRMGRLELLTPAAVAARFPAEAARRDAEGDFRYRPPGGETFGDVAARVGAVLADLHRDHRDRRVLVIAHDSVVLMFRRAIEDLTAEDLAAIVARGPVLNAAVTRFTRRADRLVLAEYNTPVARHARPPCPAPAAPSG